MGIEPTSKAWEALILPLNYARSNFTLAYETSQKQCLCASRRSMLNFLLDEI